MKRIIPSLAVLILFTVSIMSCQPEPQKQRQAEVTRVLAEKVQPTSISHAIHVSGNVKGQNTVRLGFMVPGKISDITKEEGESIRQGELLARLDAQRYQLGRDIALAKYEEVEDEYQRLSQMHEKGSITESDYVKISSGLEQAKAQYALQQKNLQDTRLYAPVSGILLKRGMEPGEITGEGTPIFVISALDTVQVHAAVPEGEIGTLSIGDSALVEIPSLDSTFVGHIQLIAPAAEPSTRTFNVKINIPNPDVLLKPGMIAELSIAGKGASQQIAINPSAILQDVDNSYYVFVADPQKSKAYKRKVTTARLSGNLVSISSGLNAGEWVITGGQNHLEDGSSISIK